MWGGCGVTGCAMKGGVSIVWSACGLVIDTLLAVYFTDSSVLRRRSLITAFHFLDI